MSRLLSVGENGGDACVRVRAREIMWMEARRGEGKQKKVAERQAQEDYGLLEVPGEKGEACHQC